MNGMYSVVVGLVVVSLLAAGGYAWSRSSSQNSGTDNASTMRDAAQGAMEESPTAAMPQQASDENTMTTDTSGNVMMEATDSAMHSDTMIDSGNSSMHETVSPEAMMTHVQGTYEAYSPERLALAQTGKVVLFFHAPWCPICHGLNSEITADLSKIPEGVHILKVDYDTATALKQKYGVTIQHTFVQVDAKGTLISKWSDASTLAQVAAHVK